MRDVILGLKQNEIITEKNIWDLKNYITKKYTGYGSGEISLVLADGINRIIDKNICQFDGEYRTRVRNNLIRRAVSKNKFEINAYEVFCECIGYGEKSENNIDLLVDWMNRNQKKPVKREEVTNLISLLDIQKDSRIDAALERALSEIHRNNEGENEEQFIDKFPGEEVALSADIEDVRVNNDGSLEWSRSQNLGKESAVLLTNIKNTMPLYYKRICMVMALCLCIMLIGINMNKIITFLGNDIKTAVNSFENERNDKDYENEALMLGSELPGDFRYIEIDRMALKGWLNGKNSMLAEEPYFSTILDISKRYDINPLLMFSIAGQEQGFVPKDQINAAKIANNPFNVYGSWQIYNTDIKDASEIAARTIISLSKGKPGDTDVIEWINRKYAEDKNWWKGVSRIYSDLKKDVVQ